MMMMLKAYDDNADDDADDVTGVPAWPAVHPTLTCTRSIVQLTGLHVVHVQA